MDKREYEDKRIRSSRMGWPHCDGKCHRGVNLGLPENGCPCDCHHAARAEQHIRDKMERLASVSGN